MGLQDNLLGLAYTRENLYLDLQEVEFGKTAWIFSQHVFAVWTMSTRVANRLSYALGHIHFGFPVAHAFRRCLRQL